MPGSPSTADAGPAATRLRRLLQFQGILDLLAVAFALLPTATIAQVHERLGLGSFPDSPIAIYLARNVSALVALHGLVLWGVATDLSRYRPLIALLGWSAITHGAWLIAIDWQAGLPGWWIAGEGPLRAVLGAATLVLLGAVASRSTPPAE